MQRIREVTLANLFPNKQLKSPKAIKRIQNKILCFSVNSKMKQKLILTQASYFSMVNITLYIPELFIILLFF